MGATALLRSLCALLGAFRGHLGLCSHAVRILHLLSGVVENNVLSLDGSAAIANIGNKHIRERVELSGGGALAVNSDLGTVHVHLTVSDEVEPRPCKESLSGWCVGWDVEVVGILHWATAEIGVDNLEGLAIVVAEGDLAGSSIVAGVSSKCQVVLLASLVGSDRLERVLVVTFAREVGSFREPLASVRVMDVSMGSSLPEGLRGPVMDQSGLVFSISIISTAHIKVNRSDKMPIHTLVELASQGIWPLHFHVGHGRSSCAKGIESEGRGTHIGR